MLRQLYVRLAFYSHFAKDMCCLDKVENCLNLDLHVKTKNNLFSNVLATVFISVISQIEQHVTG